MGEKGMENEYDDDVWQSLLDYRHLTTSVLLLQYVIVSSKKILFYNSEQDKEQSIPYMVLDIEWVEHLIHLCWEDNPDLVSSFSLFMGSLFPVGAFVGELRCSWPVVEFFSYSKLFHVRPVTQTDVYRADAKEIPRIFQVCLSTTWVVIEILNCTAIKS